MARAPLIRPDTLLRDTSRDSPRFRQPFRHPSLIFRFVAFLLFTTVTFAAETTVAARLARQAHREQDAGHVVRAYLLYSEAAVRDPRNASYAVNRDALAPVAKLLITSHVDDADIAEDIKAAEDGTDAADTLDVMQPAPVFEGNLLPPPALRPSPLAHDFDLRMDDRAAIADIARAYGIQTTFDPDFQPKQIGRFTIDHADFRTAMEAITDVSQTFVFPIGPYTIFVARDTEAKRSEYEPNIEITVPLPDTLQSRDIIEAANAVRGALHLRTISWDSVASTVVIRDQISKARTARSLLEALLLPHGQLSLEVQFLAVDTSVNYEYGTVLPNSFNIYNFAHIGGFSHPLPDLTGVAQLLIFGGGTNFFGFALTSASMIATYNSSSSKVLYDATVVVADGQTATLHVGEKYPIANALFSGFAGSTSTLANPISTTQEDLGLVLKMGGRVNGDGDITIDADAQYKSLGNQTFNTVPAINQREFKGTVRLREGECAILAGMQENDHSTSKNGIAGLSEIPGLGQLFSDNSRGHLTSDTLIVIKPTVTRLPMSNMVSPQFLLGAERGMRVIL